MNIPLSEQTCWTTPVSSNHVNFHLRHIIRKIVHFNYIALSMLLLLVGASSIFMTTTFFCMMPHLVTDKVFSFKFLFHIWRLESWFLFLFFCPCSTMLAFALNWNVWFPIFSKTRLSSSILKRTIRSSKFVSFFFWFK